MNIHICKHVHIHDIIHVSLYVCTYIYIYLFMYSFIYFGLVMFYDCTNQDLCSQWADRQIQPGKPRPTQKALKA